MGLIAFMTLGRMIVYGAGGVSLWQLAVTLVLASLSGGLGGVVYYFTDGLRAAGGVAKTFANVVTIFAYCIVALAAMFLIFPLIFGSD